ncbi:MAG: phosphate ABC transporter phosphate-binding protein, partial [Gemmatimonadales bacterium]|nr:phosphate ABC transporter phosphate-binding protein [Gemmatimonadales bacterium]
MLKYLKVLPVFAVIALAAACQTKEAEQTGTTEETAAVDTETIRQEIEDLDDQFEQGM